MCCWWCYLVVVYWIYWIRSQNMVKLVCFSPSTWICSNNNIDFPQILFLFLYFGYVISKPLKVVRITFQTKLFSPMKVLYQKQYFCSYKYNLLHLSKVRTPTFSLTNHDYFNIHIVEHCPNTWIMLGLILSQNIIRIF